MTLRIVVVEDDIAIAELLADTLQRAGFEPVITESAESAIKCFDDALPVVAVIDWMLPGESGLWLVERLRGSPRTAQIPIIMMSALDAGGARIAGVEEWVDDYVAKPFSPRDLVVRIRGLLDCRVPAGAAVLDVSPFRLDPMKNSVTVAGRNVPLRLIEFKLLRLLMSHPDRELAHIELRELIWGDTAAVDSMTIDIHMQRLRRALGAEGRAMLARSSNGGYRLATDDLASDDPTRAFVAV